jgi:hypothetical protein
MEWTVAIDVDTHKEVHVAVALDALGAQLDSLEIPTTLAGYSSLLGWTQELGVPAFAIEGRAVTPPDLFASSSKPASRSTSRRAVTAASVLVREECR